MSTTLDPRVIPHLSPATRLVAEPELADRRRLPVQYLWADDSRWLLYLHDTDGHGNWHLFRVDLGAPDDPAVDLTSLPRGSHVVTVDALVTVPDRVLVTMKTTPRHTDYVLVDVGAGESTAHLPSGPTGVAASLANRRS